MSNIPGHALLEKGLQRKKLRSNGQQPETKSDRGPGYKPLAVFLESVYTGFLFFAVPKKRRRQLFSVLWQSKWMIVLRAHRRASPRSALHWRASPRLVPPCAAAPLCLAPIRPIRGMPWFWIRQVQIAPGRYANPRLQGFQTLGSTNLNHCKQTLKS